MTWANCSGFLPGALGAELVLGNRRGLPANRAAMTPQQNFGNALAVALIELGWGHRYPDLGPLRLIRRDALDRIAMRDRGFGWTVEMQVRAVEEKLRIVEVPVRYRRRQGGPLENLRRHHGHAARGQRDPLDHRAALAAPALARRTARRMNAVRVWQVAALALLLTGAAWILPHGDLLHFGEVPPFLTGLATMSLGYLAALRVGKFSVAMFWIVGAGLRLALLAMEPGDDIFRYLWEGHALSGGINPYVYPPSAPELSLLHDATWVKIGHPHCTAIYPPLSEMTFAVLTRIGAGVTGMKAVFAIADLAVCGLLARRFGTRRALVYAWNPLVLYCFAGGGHYDSLFVLALVGSWLVWEANPRRAFLAVALAGTAVSFKWLALPLVAWMAWQTSTTAGFRRSSLLMAAGALPFALSWAMVCSWSGEWTTSLAPMEFARYARSAELIPAVLDAVTGKEWINTLFVPPLLAAWVVAIFRCRRFANAAEWFLFSAFLLSPMMHAWYFTWLLPFAALTRNRGTIALNITGTLYFIMCHRISIGEVWTLSWWERALIWLPFVAGFLSRRLYRHPRGRSELCATRTIAIPEPGT